MIIIESRTFERAIDLLMSLAMERAACVGLYASVVRLGILREGATIYAV